MANLTAVILGATGGIGQAIANILGQNGLNLVLVGRNEQALHKLCDNLAQRYPQLQLQLIRCDLAEQHSRDELIHALAALNTPIHYYINNAGINDFSLFSQQSQDTMKQMMLINVVYPLQLVQGIIPLMSKTQPSQIVYIGSTFGSIGYPGYVSYCASKFALRGATEALAREYSKTPIKFRYFSPRATNTEMNNPDVVEMNIRLGTNIDTPEFVAQEFYQFLQKGCQSYQVGYPEKIFVKVNQVVPNIVSNSIQKDLDTIYQYADKQKRG
ncbi:SDR family oxidoreductase [Acinetobacter kookii]